ncbi:GSCFA domain-containing protein [Frigidibacter oleivorans]|uniref:GSCFA domain-containing protein n=1 Tax=Frigidibacter oleivorans TaxID=2487129 RepID=UPI000F8ED5AC|nr:GSCFA domain-containing protein [Frigidibacter oleivorans]
MAGSPYSRLPPRAFWRSAVAEADPAAISDLWRLAAPPARDDRLFSLGGSVAAALHRGLAATGWNAIEAEPLPVRLPEPVLARYGWGAGSARTGPVPTLRLALEILAEAAGATGWEACAWPLDGDRAGRFVDGRRPGVEPAGLPSAEAVAAARAQHLVDLARGLAGATLVLIAPSDTRVWLDPDTGAACPAPPPHRHRVEETSLPGLRDEIAALRALLAQLAPQARLVLAISPDPAGGAAAKALLRVAMAEAEEAGTAAYFPAWELLTNPAARGALLDPAGGAPSQQGAAALLAAFTGEAGQTPAAAPGPDAAGDTDDEEDDLLCEEALLEAFRQ